MTSPSSSHCGQHCPLVTVHSYSRALTPNRPSLKPSPLGLPQEQQVVVCQMLQQQRQRELQRLTLTGALASTPSSPMISQSPNLLSSATASPLQGGQGGGLFGLQENTLHKPGVSNALYGSRFHGRGA